MKKKVLFISAANNIHTVKWVNALCNNYEVHLITCKNHNVTVNKIDKKVKVHVLKYSAPIGYYTNAIELNRIFKKIKPDIVNVHYASGYGTLARIAKVKPILMSVWGSDLYDFPRKNKINETILKKNLSASFAIASTSQNMKEEVQRLLPNVHSKIYLTPFGVDMSKFKKYKKIEKNNNEFKIGLVKGLEEKYGVSDLIVAFSKLQKKIIAGEYKLNSHKKITLYIYGEGTLKEELQKLIEKLKLQNYVFLQGKIKHDLVPNILNEFDLFCATSILESFGVSVIEAMACEVPVIVTDADGFKEIVENNKTGIIVPRRDTNKISEAMFELINNDNKRKELTKNALVEVKKKYEFKDSVKNMCIVYNEVIEEISKTNRKGEKM